MVFYGKSKGANGRKRFSTNAYRKPVLCLQKSLKVSGNLREFTGGECNLGILYSSSLIGGLLQIQSAASSCKSRAQTFKVGVSDLRASDDLPAKILPTQIIPAEILPTKIIPTKIIPAKIIKVGVSDPRAFGSPCSDCPY